MTIYAEIERQRAQARLAHESDPTNPDRFSDKAKRLVQEERARMQEDKFLEDVYIVWFCKTLQNWKALLATTGVDQNYYEVTYDGDKQTAYIDTYSKVRNTAVRDIGTVDPYQFEL